MSNPTRPGTAKRPTGDSSTHRSKKRPRYQTPVIMTYAGEKSASKAEAAARSVGMLADGA